MLLCLLMLLIVLGEVECDVDNVGDGAYVADVVGAMNVAADVRCVVMVMCWCCFVCGGHRRWR